MNKILLLAMILLFQMGHAQTEEDYQKAVDQFAINYNTKQPEKIFESFSPSLKSQFTIEKVKAFLEENQKRRGPMGTSTFLIDDDKSKRYLTEFEHTSLVLIIGLSPDLEITNLSLEEY